MRQAQLTRLWLLVSLALLIIPSASALGLSIEGRYGLGQSKYSQHEGASGYEEDGTWTIYTARGDFPIGPVNLFGELHQGVATEINVTYGAEASGHEAALTRHIVGTELLWSPLPLITIGGGVAYLSDEQNHGWKAQHPGGPGTPPFAPGDTLNWDYERSVTGLMAVASVDVDILIAQVTGRVGYASEVEWNETTKASKGNAWEAWQPDQMKASAGMFDVRARLSLLSDLSLVGGVQGFAIESPNVSELQEEYTSSEGASDTYKVTNLPSVSDHSFLMYAGISYRF